jgi:acyl dehydratase
MTDIEVGTVLPTITATFTRQTLVRYAGASTDFNPIHYSDAAAAALGLPGVIAHGMLTMGTALRVVTDWCSDPARVLSYYVRFVKSVPVPDDADGATVTFGGTVTKMEDGIATVTVEATLDGAKVLGGAKAEVRCD